MRPPGLSHTLERCSSGRAVPAGSQLIPVLLLSSTPGLPRTGQGEHFAPHLVNNRLNKHRRWALRGVSIATQAAQLSDREDKGVKTSPPAEPSPGEGNCHDFPSPPSPGSSMHTRAWLQGTGGERKFGIYLETNTAG